MGRRSASRALRHVRTLYSLGTLGDLPDSRLVELFLARGGDDAEDAFAALVDRHGPAVLGVCRRMLRDPRDAEDAFQAAFLVLARRAASIGRREQLANWLYGVAVRTCKEVRRRAARERAIERRMMEASSTRVESEPPEDREDWLPLLDEELNRLPRHYRAALLACELEGRSRREAASQLGIPEGTLSTHLARGRKLLRDRLARRGVNLGPGPIAGLSRPIAEAAIPERLMGPTVRAALDYASRSAATGAVPGAVESLAQRVLKTMWLTRLTLIVASLMPWVAGTIAAVAIGLTTPTAPSAAPDPPRVGPDDLAGRVVDRAGLGQADVEVWAIGGLGYEPVKVAAATTDGRGRFILPDAWAHRAAKATGRDSLDLFARARDGRVGWLSRHGRSGEDDPPADIELGPVGEGRGRVTDQDGRPIAGATIVAEAFWKPTDSGFSDFIALVPEAASPYRTTTTADGSYVLRGLPRGALIEATIAARGFGTPRISWNSSQAATIALDGRLGRIRGTLKPLGSGELSGKMRVYARRSGSRAKSAAGSVSLQYNAGVQAGDDGSFRFDGLPPGRYSVGATSEDDAPFVPKPIEDVDVGPNGLITVEIPLERLVKITGRVVDARTGEGVAGISVGSYRIENLYRKDARSATTDADGRYAVLAQPGTVYLEPQGLPKTYLVPSFADCPSLEVKAARAWPELKVARATGLDGIVVDANGRPAAGAEVFLLSTDRPGAPRRGEPIRTGADGTFHFDQIGPGDTLSLWSRAGDATTGGTIVVRQEEIAGKITLSLDPKHAVRIRGRATDGSGKRIAGAKVSLWWNRPYDSGQPERRGMSVGGILETRTTGEDGWFVFRGLWPDLMYNIVIEAKGHNQAEAPLLIGKAGETHDVGKIVLIDAAGHLAGRVVGSDGRPIAGAAVFSRGDSPEPVATSTDARGRFRLDGLFPGTRYVFVRKDGYRFTGVKTGDDDAMTITLLESGARPPAWQPAAAATYDEQRAFARRVLIQVWEKYGAKTGAFWCIRSMAGIDPELAMQWSAEDGHRHDDWLRHAEARQLADTDATGALAILNQKPDRQSQSALQQLADRFAETDPGKAVPFAEEAAVQARGLNQPDRTAAMARAGAVLVKLGRAEAGNRLIEDAAREAAQLPTAQRAGYCRAEVAEILAPHDPKRALALIEPIQAEYQNRHQHRAALAVAIATTDIKQAIALVDTVGGPAFFHEMARSAIAYKIGADRPDEAIRIIEGIRRTRWAPQWQAGAFGWLAVAVAPRERVRAYSLIDRALALTIDSRDWMGPGHEMAVTARVAACARRIDYPDMDSVITRVMAARPGETRHASSDRARLIQSITTAAVPLALIDPSAARTVLEQVEARGGLDPATLWNTRGNWLAAWALVDLRKAAAIVEAMLAALDGAKDVDLYNAGFREMIELLAAPPDRREEVLGRTSGGGYWRPGGGL